MRLGILRFGQPAFQVRHTLRGDRVALAVRPGPGLDTDDLDQTVPLELRERPIHLTEPQRAERAELSVVGLLEVVAVAIGLLKEAEQHVGNRHGEDYTSWVYPMGRPEESDEAAQPRTKMKPARRRT